jgi:hypothetical protein
MNLEGFRINSRIFTVIILPINRQSIVMNSYVERNENRPVLIYSSFLVYQWLKFQFSFGFGLIFLLSILEIHSRVLQNQTFYRNLGTIIIHRLKLALSPARRDKPHTHSPITSLYRQNLNEVSERIYKALKRGEAKLVTN